MRLNLSILYKILVIEIIWLEYVTTSDIFPRANVPSTIRDHKLFSSFKAAKGQACQMKTKAKESPVLNERIPRQSPSDNIRTQAGVIINNDDAVTDMIKNAGYPSETHQLRTSDDYILRIHRIPPTLRRIPASAYSGKLKNAEDGHKLAFLMHGLLSSSSDFVVTGRDHSLACTLAEAGYDVWMGNARGNLFSRKHADLNPSSPDFWDFSWHEIGMIDVPEMIDYVLNYTNHEALHYVGHSQGTTAFFVMLSMRPEYNKKILTAHMLSPIAYISHIKSSVIRNMVRQVDALEIVSKNSGIYELFPSTQFTSDVASQFCSGTFTRDYCVNVLFSLAGADSDQLNKSMLYDLFHNYPAGSSVKQAIHYGQVGKSQRFQLFDYKDDNDRVYNASQPPLYPLQNVRVPLYIFYATNDNLLSLRDAKRVIKALAPTTTKIIKLNGWGHLDFLIAIDGKKEIYSKIHATIVPEIFKTFPAGSAVKQFIHYAQIIRSGKFQLFDYKDMNEEHYNATEPPEYNMENIATPLTIFYATKDSLLMPEDVQILIPKLKSLRSTYELQGWTHMDFLLAIDAKRILFSKILTLMEDY